MKTLITSLSLVLAGQALAQAPLTKISFKIPAKELERLEAKGQAEVIVVRTPYATETAKDYSRYLKSVTAADVSLNSNNDIVGLGLKDSKGIISGEGTIKTEVGPVASAPRTNYVQIQPIAPQMKLYGSDGSPLDKIFMSSKLDTFTPLDENLQEAAHRYSRTVDLGYEFDNSTRFSVGHTMTRFKDTVKGDFETDAFIVKMSVKFSAIKR